MPELTQLMPSKDHMYKFIVIMFTVVTLLREKQIVALLV
jgi:hypothetical protein